MLQQTREEIQELLGATACNASVLEAMMQSKVCDQEGVPRGWSAHSTRDEQAVTGDVASAEEGRSNYKVGDHLPEAKDPKAAASWQTAGSPNQGVGRGARAARLCWLPSYQPLSIAGGAAAAGCRRGPEAAAPPGRGGRRWRVLVARGRSDEAAPVPQAGQAFRAAGRQGDTHPGRCMHAQLLAHLPGGAGGGSSGASLCT